MFHVQSIIILFFISFSWNFALQRIQHTNTTKIRNSMNKLLASMILPESFHSIDLEKILSKHTDYKNRKPFPHMVEDNIFPLNILSKAIIEIPDNPAFDAKTKCIKSKHSICAPTHAYIGKTAFDNDKYFGPVVNGLFSFLKSSTFIQFLEKLTGIHDLIPDPHYRGSGIHQTIPGGRLDIHTDFNQYNRYNLRRRVNVFLYLNPNWNEVRVYYHLYYLLLLLFF